MKWLDFKEQHLIKQQNVFSVDTTNKFHITSSDYEGRFGFIQRDFLLIQKLLKKIGYNGELPSIKITDKLSGEFEFNIPDNFIFGFLGDATDHGPYDIRILKALTKTTHNCYLIIGNRDANKLRPMFELLTKEQIIDFAIYNNIGSWEPDNKNRINPENCLLRHLMPLFTDQQIKKLDLYPEFFEDHVHAAQQTSKSKPIKPYSQKYLIKCDNIRHELSKSDFTRLRIATLQWLLSYTMGCAKNHLWDNTFKYRRDEILSLEKNNNLTDIELNTLVLDSYTNKSSKYNLAIDYLKRAKVAQRVGNCLVMHGCLDLSSFNIPNTNLNIDSYNHIDEWIEAINWKYQESLERFLHGDELSFSDVSTLTYCIRFALDKGLANINYLKQEYEIRLHAMKSTNNKLEAKKLMQMLDKIELIINYDGTGSTIGSNQYQFESNEELKEIGIKLNQKVIKLLRASNINTIQAGHVPMGDMGLFCIVDDSDIAIACIDPTYADQNRAAVTCIQHGQTTLMLATDIDEEISVSAIDSYGERRVINIDSLSIGKDGFDFKFTDQILVTKKAGFETSTETVKKKLVSRDKLAID